MIDRFTFQYFSFKDELGTLKATIAKLESEKASLQEDNQRLQQNVRSTKQDEEFI